MSEAEAAATVGVTSLDVLAAGAVGMTTGAVGMTTGAVGMTTGAAGATTGPGSLFSLVLGSGCGSGARVAGTGAGGLPTARIAGSTKAGGGAGCWARGGVAGTTFGGGAVGTSERSAMSAEGIVRRGFHSLVLSSQTVGAAG